MRYGRYFGVFNLPLQSTHELLVSSLLDLHIGGFVKPVFLMIRHPQNAFPLHFKCDATHFYHNKHEGFYK